MEMGCREMGKRFEEASSHQGFESRMTEALRNETSVS